MTSAAKNAEVSRRIVAAVDGGLTVKEAVDQVLGEGVHAALAGAVYDALRAKASR